MFYESKIFSEFDKALYCKKWFNEYELPGVIVTTGPEFVKTAQGNELLADTLNPSNKFSASYHEITNLSQQHFKSEKAEEHKLSSEETTSVTDDQDKQPSLECKYY